MREREVLFLVGVKPLDVVGNLKYLGRVLEFSGGNFKALFSNLGKTKNVWGEFGMIFGR